MEDHGFLAAFEAGTLPEELFHHRNHVRAGWLVLREVSPAFSLARFSSALRRFASRLGKADRYHETITWAYLLLINERMERTGRRRELAGVRGHKSGSAHLAGNSSSQLSPRRDSPVGAREESLPSSGPAPEIMAGSRGMFPGLPPFGPILMA